MIPYCLPSPAVCCAARRVLTPAPALGRTQVRPTGTCPPPPCSLPRRLHGGLGASCSLTAVVVVSTDVSCPLSDSVTLWNDQLPGLHTYRMTLCPERDSKSCDPQCRENSGDPAGLRVHDHGGRHTAPSPHRLRTHVNSASRDGLVSLTGDREQFTF